jgi:hypothetical protein
MESHDVNQGCKCIDLTEDDGRNIYTILCAGKRSSRWCNRSESFLLEVFSSTLKLIKELTGYELDEIVKYLRVKFPDIGIKQSMSKSQKVKILSKELGHFEEDSTMESKKPKRTVVKTLFELSKKVVNGKNTQKRHC